MFLIELLIFGSLAIAVNHLGKSDADDILPATERQQAWMDYQAEQNDPVNKHTIGAEPNSGFSSNYYHD